MRRRYLVLLTFLIISLSLPACTVEATPTAEIQQQEATSTLTPPPSATVYVDPIPIEDIQEYLWLLNTVIEKELGGEEKAVGEYNLRLLDDGTFTFRADCNDGTGSYQIDGSIMSLDISPLTLAACEQGSFSEQYITWLESVSSFGSLEGDLILRLEEGQGEMWYTNMGVPTPTPTPTITSTPEGTVTPTIGTEETPTPSIKAPPPSTEIIFSDDFSINRGWHTGSSRFGEFKFVSGTYQITNDVLNANLWSVRSIESEDIGQQIEVVRLNGSAGGYYGVMCRVNHEVDNYYAFTISSDGTYGIGTMENGVFRFLENNEDTDGVVNTDPGTLNTIRGDCIGDRLALYVNGQLIIDLIDATHGYGEVGLMTGTWGDPGLVVRFDNYEVFQP